MVGPPAKKRKYSCKKNNMQFLEVGLKGFFATCNFNEKECVNECYNLLNNYANELYGKEDANKVNEGADKPVSDDIADELQKQISDTKLKTKRLFQVVCTGAANCVFIKTTLDDPITLGGRIVKDILDSKEQKTRFLLRLVPIDAVCKANEKDIVNTASQLYDKYFPKEPTTFSIVLKRRYHNDINRDQMIRVLADVIHKKNDKHKVDIKYAKISLVVEIIKGLCCLTVLDDYMAMKKYNLVSLANDNQETGRSMEIE